MKYQTKKVIEVSDWDNLVEETYGKIYSFQQQDDCKDRGVYNFSVPSKYKEDFENDTIPEVINGEEMGVSFKAWLERDPKEWNGDSVDKNYIYLFWERNFYPDVNMIINDLYEKGLLEKGEYSINIDW